MSKHNLVHVRRRGRRLVVAHFPRRRRTLFRPGHLVVTHIFPVLDDPLEVVLDHPVDLRHQLLHQLLQRETAPRQSSSSSSRRDFTHRLRHVDHLGQLLQQPLLRLVILGDPAEAAQCRDDAGAGHSAGIAVHEAALCNRTTTSIIAARFEPCNYRGKKPTRSRRRDEALAGSPLLVQPRRP
jgi:hypothetical protein